MKRRKLKEKNRIKVKNNEKQNVAIIVDMKERKSIKIFIPEEADIVDKEILQLQILAQKQREEMKRAYYSVNSPISSTINRSFSDLFKRFIQLKTEKLLNSKTV